MSSRYFTTNSSGSKRSLLHHNSNGVTRQLFDLDAALSSPSNDKLRLIECCIYSASSLPKTDGRFNNVDPYIVALYGPLTYQSRVFHDAGSNPTFTQESPNDGSHPVMFTFPDLGVPRLTLVLHDHDYFRSDDDFLGRAEIPINDGTDSGNSETSIQEIELTECDGTRREKTTSWLGSSSGVSKLRYSISRRVGAWPKPSLKVLCHHRKVAGILKSFETGNFKWHKSWEISLMYVRAIFGEDTQHWNEKYSKAQQIFSQDFTSSGILRSWLSSANSLLYQGNLFDTTMLTIEGGEELLVLLKYGFSKSTKRQKIYTYVILQSSLFFSETGKSVVADLVSKHAVHAGASTTVVYSGEFHVSKSEDGEPILVFDNNSGTYSPDSKDLDKLLLLLKANFPGISIDCVDHQSPMLAEYKKRVGLLDT